MYAAFMTAEETSKLPSIVKWAAFAFAYGVLKSQLVGSKRFHEPMLPGYGIGELGEELLYRVLPFEGAKLANLNVDPSIINFGQAFAFGAAHTYPVEAGLGGLFYGVAYQQNGLLGSWAAHVAHNIGVWVGAK